MPLLWAIRDIIGLTGTKFGCGVSQCGACSVLINGNLTKSCSIPVSYAEGKEIFTIEGSSENLEFLRAAWNEGNVPQMWLLSIRAINCCYRFIRQNSKSNK